MEIIEKVSNLYNKEPSDAIDYAYGKIDDIIDIFKKYIGSDGKPIDYKTNFSREKYEELLKVEKDDWTICTLLRLQILMLNNKYTAQTLLEKDEIVDSKTNIIYNLQIADTPLKIKLYMLYLTVYALEAYMRKKYSKKWKSKVGIDYEFHKNIIALMQLNFETYSSDKYPTTSYIWLTNPGEFDEKQMSLLFKLLMTNLDIHKILHGADSLDMIYMTKTMFNGDKELIGKFLKNVVDTRFLCEYHLANEGYDKKQCSIYESLYRFKTISQDRYEFLNSTYDNMGAPQDVLWDIHKLSSFHVKYALYDVLFLKHHVQSILDSSKKHIPFIYPSFEYIAYLTSFIYSEKFEVTNITATVKQIVDPMNNYLIMINNKPITLINIYSKEIEHMRLEDIGVDVDSMFGVNYFRSTLKTIFKYIVYCVIAKYHKIWKTKAFYLHFKLNPQFDTLYEPLRETYKELMPLMTSFQREMENKISMNYK